MKKYKEYGVLWINILIILALVFTFPSLPTSNADTTIVSEKAFSAWDYDIDENDSISNQEALNAVVDFFAGEITKQEALEVIVLFFDNPPTWNGGGQAILGPLCGADTSIYSLVNLGTPVFTGKTCGMGTFGATLEGLNVSDFILIAINGGTDTDANDDDIPDPAPTTNHGTIHALTTVADYSQEIMVSALTDIAWRYTESLVGEASSQTIQIRLNDLAELFIEEDIDGNGIVDALDLTAFNPTEQSHKDKLRFDYNLLFEDHGSGNSIIGAYHDGDTELLLELLEDMFGVYLSMYPVVSQVSETEIIVCLSPFGSGTVTVDQGDINWSSGQDDSLNTTCDFYPEDMSGTITFTAIPTEDSEILSWSGVDQISTDMTQATVFLRYDRQVEVSFGYNETIVNPEVVDLSQAQVVKSGSTLTVNIDTADIELIAQMALIAPGWVVFRPVEDLFLLEVTSVNQVSDLEYILETEQASLTDVVYQATYESNGFLTNENLVEPGSPMLYGNTKIYSLNEQTGVEGVYLTVPDDPDNTVFTIQFGNPANKTPQLNGATPKWEYPIDPGTIMLHDAPALKVGVSGKLNFKIEPNLRLDVGLRGCGPSDWFWHPFWCATPIVKELALVPDITINEELHLKVSGNGEFEHEIPLFQEPIKLGRVTATVYGVPVFWMPVYLNFWIGVDGEINGVLRAGMYSQQNIKAGLIYRYNTGTELIGDAWHDESFYANLNVDLEARAWVRPKVSFRFYDVGGPTISVKPYLKLMASAMLDLLQWCNWGVDISLYFGISVLLGVDIDEAAEKFICEKLDVEELPLPEWEWVIHEWPLWEWSEGGSCDADLAVQGMNIDRWGESGIIQEAYTVSNIGNAELNWSASTTGSQHISFSPNNGTLEPDQQVDVTVTVDTTNMNPWQANYHTIRFQNDGNTDDYEERSIRISLCSDLAAPILEAPALVADENGIKVQLQWAYPDNDTVNYVRGYDIYSSTNGTDLQKELYVLGSATATCLVSVPIDGRTYYFHVVAFSYGCGNWLHSDPSNTESIDIEFGLEVSSTTGGSVTSPGKGLYQYDHGTAVPIVAEASPCYEFVNWSGSRQFAHLFLSCDQTPVSIPQCQIADVNDPTTTVTMDRNYQVRANFQLKTVDLNTSSTIGGSVIVPGEGAYPYGCGTVVAIVAEASPCYEFINWSGATSTIADVNDPSTHITMNDDCAIIANFVRTQYDLTTSSVEGGLVTVPGEGTYPYDCGTVVAIVAEASPCYEFVSWSGSISTIADVNNPNTTIMMSDNYSIEANFQFRAVDLNTSSTTGGSAIVPGEGVYPYDCGTVVAIVAEASQCYEFINWSGSISTIADVNDPITNITMNDDYAIAANFAKIQYALTTSSGEGGAVTKPGEGVYPYECGTLVAIVAEASPCYEFINWSGDTDAIAGVNDPTTTIIINDSYSIQANFQLKIVDIHIYSYTGGSVMVPGEGTYTYVCGTVVDIEAEAETGYHFDRWFGLGDIQNRNNPTTTVTMNGNYSIEANFLEDGTFQPMVAAGDTHTLGLKKNGAVLSTGYNDAGQCNVGSWTFIQEVAAGYYHSVGLKADGTVVTVGWNSNGQCNVEGWADIVQIDAGEYHTTGMTSGGTVIAIGSNLRGQCDVISWANIQQIAAGGQNTVGLKADGTVVAVGWNSNGQCNVGTWTFIQEVAAGDQHTVGLTNGGTVVAVGNNDWGQCNVTGWADIVQIDAGGNQTVGLKSDGTVVAMGDNGEGQCDVDGWTDIVQIDAGEYHTVGMKSDGTVVAVGRNIQGHCDVESWDLDW